MSSQEESMPTLNCQYMSLLIYCRVCPTSPGVVGIARVQVEWPLQTILVGRVRNLTILTRFNTSILSPTILQQ